VKAKVKKGYNPGEKDQKNGEHTAEITRAASWQWRKKRQRQGPQMQNEIECAGSKCVKGAAWVNINGALDGAVGVAVRRSVG